MTITAPFTSIGGIDAGMIAPGQAAPELIFQGTGLATITLQAEIAPNRYVFQSANYTFYPTPEPAGIFLMGLGLLFLAALRSRGPSDRYSGPHLNPGQERRRES